MAFGFQCSAETFAYYTCLVVVFVDLLGQHFTLAVNVPYSQEVGASIKEVSYLLTANMGCRLLGNLVMPKLADITSRKLTMQLSTVGSCVAYFISGAAIWFSGRDGFWVLLGGRALGGLFGGSLGLAIAYITELTMPDLNNPADVRTERMDLLKSRITMVMAVFNVAPICLAPIGGSVGTLGLNIPFLIASAVAFVGLLFTLKFMKDVDEVKALSISEYTEAAEVRTNEIVVEEGEIEGIDEVGVEMTEPPHPPADSSTPPEQADSSSAPPAGSSPEAAAAAEGNNDGAKGERKRSGVVVMKERRPSDNMKVRDSSLDLSADEKERLSKEKPQDLANPWTDKIILVSGLGYFCLGNTFIMIMLLLPFMLEQDKFGLAGETGTLARGEDVAKIVGLVSIPQGGMGFLCQSFLYLFLSRNGWSDQLVMAIGCSLMTGSLFGMAFVDELYQYKSVDSLFACGIQCSSILFSWLRAVGTQVFLAAAGIGAGQGLALGLRRSNFRLASRSYASTVAQLGVLTGAWVAMPTTYVATNYQHAVAQARSIPINFMYCGFAVGPLIAGEVWEAEGQNTSWYVASCMMGLATILLLITARMIEHSMADPIMVSFEEIKTQRILETNALPRKEFLTQLHSDVEQMLDERNYHLWNGRALPPLRKFSAKDHGQAHLEDIAHILLHDLDDYEAFRALEMRSGRNLSGETNQFGVGNAMGDALNAYEDTHRSANKLTHRRDAALSPVGSSTAPDPYGVYDTKPYDEKLSSKMSEEDIEKALYGQKQH